MKQYYFLPQCFILLLNPFKCLLLLLFTDYAAMHFNAVIHDDIHYFTLINQLNRLVDRQVNALHCCSTHYW